MAAEIGEEHPLVTVAVEQLVALELLEVRRPPGAEDRELRLTARGHVRAAAWDDTRREVLDRALDALSAQERAAIAIALPALERLAFALGDC